jgi:hypothetical protein
MPLELTVVPLTRSGDVMVDAYAIPVVMAGAVGVVLRVTTMGVLADDVQFVTVFRMRSE